MSRNKGNTVKKQILAFATFASLTLADFVGKAKEKCKVSEAVAKAKDKFVEDLKEFSKLVAAGKRLYTTRIENREIPGDTSFKKWWKNNVGYDLPGRAESLAAFFNAMVLTLVNGVPLISEEIFDEAHVDWLEKANAIVNTARKAHGDKWMGCDDVLDVINALSKPGDAGKKLAEIRKRQKGEKPTDGVVETPALTVKMAAAFLLASIQQCVSKSKDEQYALCCSIWELNTAWAGLPPELTTEHDTRYQENAAKGVAPHMEVITSAGQTPEGETPNTETDEAAPEQPADETEAQETEQPMAAAA
jgi:hypothetical protein